MFTLKQIEKMNFYSNKSVGQCHLWVDYLKPHKSVPKNELVKLGIVYKTLSFSNIQVYMRITWLILIIIKKRSVYYMFLYNIALKHLFLFLILKKTLSCPAQTFAFCKEKGLIFQYKFHSTFILLESSFRKVWVFRS